MRPVLDNPTWDFCAGWTEREFTGEQERSCRICKEVQINVWTHYPWRKEYGGLKFDQARKGRYSK